MAQRKPCFRPRRVVATDRLLALFEFEKKLLLAAMTECRCRKEQCTHTQYLESQEKRLAQALLQEQPCDLHKFLRLQRMVLQLMRFALQNAVLNSMEKIVQEILREYELVYPTDSIRSIARSALERLLRGLHTSLYDVKPDLAREALHPYRAPARLRAL